jgi:hypothetical protein
MTGVKLRPAKKKDFDFFFKDDPVKYSARAWVLHEKGNRLAIGGIWLIPGQYTSFIRLRDYTKKKNIWKASIEVHKMLKTIDSNIICERDRNISNSARFLEKLGYRFLTERYNKEIYLWHKQLFR